jgi:hypothetical protein
MHHTFSATLADSRQRELSALARRPDHLMARALELADAAPGRRGFRRARRSAESRGGPP